jgi:uncharacterized membrane protein YgaE (UPF0421/DUF939 family)
VAGRIGPLSQRLWRVRWNTTFAVQSGVAAGLAWLVAHNLIGHQQPFFAPIAAVIVLSASEGLRWQRALELIGGVALGIGLADAIVVLVGVGVVQIVGVVTLAMLVTVFLGGGNLAVAQAASSAVLVVTVAPQVTGLSLSRLVDALIGGAVGLAVMSLVLPHNPLTRVRTAADAALTQLADAVALTADALRAGDPGRARRALADLRAGESRHQDLAESLTLGRETALLSPLQWRRRPLVGRYLRAAVHVERATRNVRVLARRAASVLAGGEPIPAALPEALDALALSVRTLREELAAGREPAVARIHALKAVRGAGGAYRAGVGFSGSVMVAQIRGAVVDLLRGTGLPEERADRLVDGVTDAPYAPSG